jgi:malonyl-CoA decarboxylase
MGFPWFRRERAVAPRPSESSAILDLCQRVLAPAAESSGTRVAADLVATAAALEPAERLAWFEWLTQELAPAERPLSEAARSYLAAPSPHAAARLTRAAEPPRQALLRRMNTADGGTALLVSLRAELLALLPDHPQLAPLEDDLAHLLASWFNRGFLSLQRIDWRSPAALLEKLVAYEAVHAIRDWDDLRRRLERDRRCYGFFHPAMPGEPLIFVEVALTKGLPSAITEILDAPLSSGDAADTAVFYSISNCHAGLRGVSFGNLLIKQIVGELRAELPSVTRFGTLSPVPTLAQWLRSHGADRDLVSSCERYLMTNRLGAEGTRIDPVAHFHFSNGARLERILPDADTSGKGRSQSRGVMVNYVYELADIESNARSYLTTGNVASSLDP